MRIVKRVTALFLVFALAGIFTSFFFLQQASAGRADQENTTDPTPTPPPQPDTEQLQLIPIEGQAPALNGQALESFPEVVERRTAYSRHYQVGPNQYRAQISAAPLHYQDANGQWQPIDTQPKAQAGGGFKIEANTVKITFPQRLAQQGLAINATIYPELKPEATDLPEVKRVKPDLATMPRQQAPDNSFYQKPLRELALQWQPQSLLYSRNSGSPSTLFQFSAAEARAIADGVEYLLPARGVSLAIRSSSTGLVQELQLNNWLPGIDSGPGSQLEYMVQLSLPADVHLYAQGSRQTGSFTTNHLELRDENGNRLMVLSAPYLKDQANSRTSPQAQYHITPTPGGVLIATALPLDWLADPARQYPVTVRSSLITISALSSFNAIQDTFLWDCRPNNIGDLLDPNNMWVGNFIATNGCAGNGFERSLVQWVVSSLPQDILISPPSDPTTESFLWREPSEDVGAANVRVNSFLLFRPWNQGQANWLNAQTGLPWGQPGAEGDYFLSPEGSVVVPPTDPQGYRSMGSLASAVSVWHTFQYFAPWGYPNRGIIYISGSETTPNLDRGFGTANAGRPPILDVRYVQNQVYIPAVNNNYFFPHAPSPDYIRIAHVPGWRAVGIRALDGRSDYDLFLSDTDVFTRSDILATSQRVGNVPDFVVIRPQVSNPLLFPWVMQWEGTGLYYFRYASANQLLSLGNPVINSVASTFTVLSAYNVNLTANQDFLLRLDPTSGNADLGFALFPPAGSGFGENFMNIGDAVAGSDSPVFAGSEAFVYRPPVTGVYGLVVWNNGGTQTTNYRLSLDTGSRVFIPTLFKVFAEPTAFGNGGFENNQLTPWLATNLGGPMVVSRVSNPSGNCFSGNFSARLGTPGKLADGTIPVGTISLRQVFTVPPNATTISFKYQVSTYDIIQGSVSGREYDSFKVYLNDSLRLTVGNPAGSSNGQTLWESGCRTGTINVSAFRGQNITLRFSVNNLNSPNFNTWAYVDNVQIQ